MIRMASMKRQMPRFVTVFFLLALSGFIILVCNITYLEKLSGQVISTFYQIQNSIHSAFKSPGNVWPLELNHTYCAHFGQEPTAEEANEERYLLNSIAWPGPLVQGLLVELSSDPSKSYFVIHGPAEQHIGDQLEVNVHVQNFLGLPKKHGGDFLIARLHSPELGAGVAGQVQDHHNGNYTVLFPLLWAGVVWVEITMAHPSEAVVVLKRLQEEQPNQVYFKSLFRSGFVSETTVCNLCLPLNHQPLCNYTDPETGEPWYCYKPKMLGCDTRINHYKGGYKKNLITGYETKFFKSNVNIKVPIRASGMGNVTVLPADKGLANLKKYEKTSGFYFHNVWRPLRGAALQQFNDSSAITQCLRGKIIYMLVDSTVRQWFEYLTASVPTLKEFNIHSLKKVGPFLAVDSKNNILVSFHCHGPPIRFTSVLSPELHYVANEIDRIKGGPGTVILVSVWSHFSTFPIEVYIRRLRHIRRAVVRLLNREPATLVVIRTANLQKLDPGNSLFNSDWFSLQINSVLCAMFKGLNVQLLDAWEMTLAHHLPHLLHPSPPIIKNMIDLILSNICPAGKNRRS
ncbi:NXPE family member 3-like [Hemibagrus wyckioides]|uniref:NXPE family member 3-like n=1 Tax=Hemibagrus wyckioides TaxID=337641 RepID=UPI00266B46FC|nr:NXPE family member 3-like [Hemibagrus wyckioides]